MKQYPYIRETGNILKSGRIGLKGEKCKCGEVAAVFIDTAYSYMVGDDETECFCMDCYREEIEQKLKS
jgi:hypothetical protein